MDQSELRVLRDSDLIRTVEQAIDNYRGDVTVLENAIGCMMFCRAVGWKVVLLMHDRQTIKKYERILGISFRDHFPEVGELADRSLAWRAAQKIKGFWKIVKGEVAGIKSVTVDAGEAKP